MNLRPYQRQASDCIFDQWKSCASTLLDLPTGVGKTIVLADVVRRVFPRRAIVVAHRRELIKQAVDKITRVTGIRCDVEMGEYRANEHGLFSKASVVVSTVQTLTSGNDGYGRLGKFNPQDFGLLVIDECHHSTAASYRRIVDYFRQNEALKVLGVTATPKRADEEALKQVFETVAFRYELNQAVDDGWLVPIRQQMVTIHGLDYSHVKTTDGDLNGAELSKVLEAERVAHEIASATIDIIGARRTIIFTVSVKQAMMTAEIMNRHRPGMAAHVYGEMDHEDRSRVLKGFETGEIQVVCNFGVLTEGFDNAAVEVVVMGRLTKSHSTYVQMLGRGTRPLPNTVETPETPEARRAAIAASAKPFCTIVDFVGNAGRHKLVTSADILGGNVSPQARERVIKRAKKTGQPVDISKELIDEEKKLNEEKIKADEARKKHIILKARYSVQNVDPFDVLSVKPVVARPVDNRRELTEKQRALLMRQGINPDAVPYAQAKQLVGEIISRFDRKLCSFKQGKILRRFGYDTNVSFEAASQIIDGLAKNGWKRPMEVETL